jgi:hypothetical protein
MKANISPIKYGQVVNIKEKELVTIGNTTIIPAIIIDKSFDFISKILINIIAEQAMNIIESNPLNTGNENVFVLSNWSL